MTLDEVQVSVPFSVLYDTQKHVENLAQLVTTMQSRVNQQEKELQGAERRAEDAQRGMVFHQNEESLWRGRWKEEQIKCIQLQEQIDRLEGTVDELERDEGPAPVDTVPED